MQALVITAYQNKTTLKRNLELFSKRFECFVHIDKKSPINTPEFLEELNSLERVTAISEYKINWGSYLHMMAILRLLQMALKKTEIDRIHIISGEDFPVKSYEEFHQFFEVEHPKENFIELTDIRNMPMVQRRYTKFHFQHIFNRKSKNKLIIFIDKAIRQMQYHLPFERKTRFDYKGLVWSSLSREGAERVLEYVTPKRIEVLKYTEAAEEFMVQNALMGSELEKTVVTDNLRFADWNQCLTGPKVLNIKDYEKIKKSACFFARKIHDKEDEPEAKALYDRVFLEFNNFDE